MCKLREVTFANRGIGARSAHSRGTGVEAAHSQGIDATGIAGTQVQHKDSTCSPLTRASLKSSEQRCITSCSNASAASVASQPPLTACLTAVRSAAATLLTPARCNKLTTLAFTPT